MTRRVVCTDVLPYRSQHGRDDAGRARGRRGDAAAARCREGLSRLAGRSTKSVVPSLPLRCRRVRLIAVFSSVVVVSIIDVVVSVGSSSSVVLRFSFATIIAESVVFPLLALVARSPFGPLVDPHRRSSQQSARRPVAPRASADGRIAFPCLWFPLVPSGSGATCPAASACPKDASTCSACLRSSHHDPPPPRTGTARPRI